LTETNIIPNGETIINWVEIQVNSGGKEDQRLTLYGMGNGIRRKGLEGNSNGAGREGKRKALQGSCTTPGIADAREYLSMPYGRGKSKEGGLSHNRGRHPARVARGGGRRKIISKENYK